LVVVIDLAELVPRSERCVAQIAVLHQSIKSIRYEGGDSQDDENFSDGFEHFCSVIDYFLFSTSTGWGANGRETGCPNIRVTGEII